MFSGIVEAVGSLETLEAREGGIRLSVRTPELWPKLENGGSLSVSGVCLTVASKKMENIVCMDVVPETAAKTTLGDLKEGGRVNLELPLRLSDLVGGHLVSGHIDGVGKVVSIRPEGEGKRMSIRPPSGLMKYVAYKGSVAIAGVSLTVAAIGEENFDVALIPYTLDKTTLGELEAGARVNLEADLVAKYLERLLAAHGKN